MTIRMRYLVSAALLLAGLSAGCVSSDPDRAAQRRHDSAADRDWVNRRASQLRASGLNDGEARGKAEAEFRSQFGYSPDAPILHDSGAKARAEQQQVNEGLARLQRDR